MQEINVLDSSIFNRIAAGEVVENPRSVIKELVENSIDAGALNISIEIRLGGIEFIRVTDDGKGINKQDVPIAFLPHATSKIQNLQDLNAISTLGFRGEALPSIASVSHITFISRKKEKELGYKIIYNHGLKIDEGECGHPQGTSVTVENLFKNIPARFKFLRKPISEEGDVTDLVEKIILANPNVSIKYITNERIKFHSSGKGIKDAIYSVYGSDFITNLTEISNVMSHISLRGYVGNPNFTKSSRNFQVLIVNGRYVINPDISYCVQQCYQDYLMKRQFPIFILYLEMPLDMVDVNIHPSKLNVKFADFSKLKGLIYNEVKHAISGLLNTPKEVTHFSTSGDVKITQDLSSSLESEVASSKTSHPAIAQAQIKSSFMTGRNQLQENARFSKLLNDYAASKNDTMNKAVASAPESILSDEIAPINNQQVQLNTNQNDFYEALLDCQVIGKIFNTYLIVQNAANIYMIDQHAAHEKILYDKYSKQFEENKIVKQDMLIPYIFDISYNEQELLEERMDELEKMGFVINRISDAKYSLSSVPACCTLLNNQEFISNILFSLKNTAKNKPLHYFKEQLMQSACKAAVKGEMDLSKEEISALLQSMIKDNSILFCPHGRPTVIKLTKTEIEKWFKRI